MDKVLTKLAFPLLLVLITFFYIQHRHTILDNIVLLTYVAVVKKKKEL